MSIVAPDRTVEQRRAALDRANWIRLRRARLKRDIAAGRVALVPVIEDPPWWLMTAKVFELLMAVHRVGEVKAGGILNRCRVPLAKTVGGLTQRQRGELAMVLRARGVR